MTSLDWVMVALYFGVLLGVAWWVVRKSKDTADDYFLAGRNLSWWIVGASIFASNIGSEHIVGLAGSGATDGVALAHYELHAWCLLVLGLGVRAVLHALAGVHDAGVPREALLGGVALRAVDRLAHHVHRLQDRGRHLRRRRGVRDAAAGAADRTSARVHIDSFWIGSVR